jgi:hypothetical protein
MSKSKEKYDVIEKKLNTMEQQLKSYEELLRQLNETTALIDYKLSSLCCIKDETLNIDNDADKKITPKKKRKETLEAYIKKLWNADKVNIYQVVSSEKAEEIFKKNEPEIKSKKNKKDIDKTKIEILIKNLTPAHIDKFKKLQAGDDEDKEPIIEITPSTTIRNSSIIDDE